MEEKEKPIVGIMATYRTLFPKFGAIGEKAIIKILKGLQLSDCLLILSKLSRHNYKYVQHALTTNLKIYKERCLELIDEPTRAVIKEHEAKDEEFFIIFPHLSILHLVKLCLMHCQDSGYEEAESFPATTLNQIGKCLLICNDVMADWQQKGDAGMATKSEEILVNLTKQQIVEKSFNVYQKLAQTLFVYSKFLKKYKDQFDIEKIFQGKYGLSVIEYFAFLHGLFSQFLIKNTLDEDFENPYLQLDIALRDVKPKFEQTLLENLIMKKNRYNKVGNNFFDVSMLYKTPLTELAKDKVLIPFSLKGLFLAITETIYFDILDSLSTKLKSDFSKYFGMALEDYAADILYHIDPNIILPFSYEQGQNQTPDGILLQDDEAIFFECKKRQFHTLEFMQSGTKEMYHQRLQEFIKIPLNQIYQRVQDFRTGKFSLNLKKDAVIYPVVICPIAPPLFPGGWDMYNLDQYILPEGFIEDKKLSRPEVVDMNQLESIEEYLKENPAIKFVDLIKEKQADPRYNGPGWEIFLYHKRASNQNSRILNEYMQEMEKFKDILFGK